VNIEFTPDAWEDFHYWTKNDKSKVDKIHDLIRSIQQNPFKGLGNPEPLRHDLKGFWSRKIDHEHRLIYRIKNTTNESQKIQIIQCRYHY